MTVNLTDGCQSGAVRNALAARGGALLSLPDVPEGGPERRLRRLRPSDLKIFAGLAAHPQNLTARAWPIDTIVQIAERRSLSATITRIGLT
jgi:hypothetical protein